MHRFVVTRLGMTNGDEDVGHAPMIAELKRRGNAAVSLNVLRWVHDLEALADDEHILTERLADRR
jgi:hypothetical protein